MPISSLTSYSPIPNGSAATPGLWDSRFLTVQSNLSQLASDTSVFAGTGSIGTTQSVLGFSANTLRAESGNTTVVQPYSTALVTKSIDSGGAVFNGAAFGMVAGGGTDNANFLQSAVSAANLAGGGTVYVSGGTYTITSHSISMLSGVEVVGAGRGATVFQVGAGATFQELFSFSTCSFGALRRCRLDGNKTAAPGSLHGIRLTQSTDILLEDLALSNFTQDGSYWGPNVGNTPNERIIARDWECLSNGRNGLSVIQAKDFVISNLVGVSNGHADVDIEPNSSSQIVQRGTLSNFILRGSTDDGLVLFNNVGATFQDLQVANVVISGGGASGAEGLIVKGERINLVNVSIATWGGSGANIHEGSQNISWTGGALWGNQSNGVGVGAASSWATNITLEALSIDSNGDTGISATSVVGLSIIGNRLRNNSQRQAGIRGGMLLSGCNNSRVVANRAHDSQTSKTQRHGLRTLTSCSTVQVSANDFEGNITAAADDDGTTTNYVAFSNTPSLSFERAAVPDGGVAAPTVAFASELSLGLFRSAASTAALSYGTLSLGGGYLASLKTATSINSLVLGANAIAISNPGVSGCSLVLNINGVQYHFNSSGTTIGR